MRALRPSATPSATTASETLLDAGDNKIPRSQHDLARHLRRLRHPLSPCFLASRWKEYIAFLRSFYVADDIWRFARSLVGCLLAPSWLPTMLGGFREIQGQGVEIS